jgi:tRNA-Thr(GGU) m(6)t(6)A37 methyltransferase TsaA
MEPPATLEVEPIGWVRNDISDSQDVAWEEIESQVVIEERFSEALEGLEEFSHIIVIFWLHKRKEESPPLKIHPEQREDMPLVGVLATRAPVRPNPIGLTVVPLLERRGNILVVRGLDAYDGTPVLDIKPYLPKGDHIPEAKIPEWLRRLWESGGDPKR